MQILLIGNGFDIEHGLPTSYYNFLEFCVRIREIFAKGKSISLNDYIDSCDERNINNNVSDVINKIIQKKINEDNAKMDNSINGHKVMTSDSVFDELYTLIYHNAWLEYFLNSPSYIGETWIDFESEISRVIRVLDDVMVLTIKNIYLGSLSKSKSSILTAIVKFSRKSMRETVGNIKAINNFILFLNTELERLIRALEIYIAEFVDKVPVTKRNMDIVHLTPDHILSFNYSNTYERVYGQKKQIEYDYIHGKADIKKNVHTSNLVLGIDEYLNDDRKNMDLELIMFKKFYQRIFKSTGNGYLNWVDEIRADLTCRHNLYIFGHSLDITDRDVINLFVCNDNVQTKIFYYRENIDDKKVLGKMIRNLVRIIGQEELIRRTGGEQRTIEFVPQAI